MNEQERHDLFSELVTRHQSQLYAYIFALIRNRDDAADLLQSVCLTLWRRFDSFRPGSSFFSWARQTAKNEVRNAIRRKRCRTRVGEELLDILAETALDSPGDATDLYLAALRQCKSQLNDADEQLLALRYVEDLGTRQIADRIGRPQQSVCNSFVRIRRVLFDCIQRELARQEHSAEDGR